MFWCFHNFNNVDNFIIASWTYYNNLETNLSQSHFLNFFVFISIFSHATSLTYESDPVMQFHCLIDSQNVIPILKKIGQDLNMGPLNTHYYIKLKHVQWTSENRTHSKTGQICVQFSNGLLALYSKTGLVQILDGHTAWNIWAKSLELTVIYRLSLSQAKDLSCQLIYELQHKDKIILIPWTALHFGCSFKLLPEDTLLLLFYFHFIVLCPVTPCMPISTTFLNH
jgi:hypothetical protein